MQPSVIMTSITGKPLGEVFETFEGFAFTHYESATTQDGFDTFYEARDAFMACHNEWFDNI